MTSHGIPHTPSLILSCSDISHVSQGHHMHTTWVTVTHRQHMMSHAITQTSTYPDIILKWHIACFTGPSHAHHMGITWATHDVTWYPTNKHLPWFYLGVTYRMFHRAVTCTPHGYYIGDTWCHMVSHKQPNLFLVFHKQTNLFFRHSEIKGNIMIADFWTQVAYFTE